MQIENKSDTWFKQKDMITALLWSRIRKLCHENQLDHLYEAITSISLENDVLKIRSQEPMIQAELLLFLQNNLPNIASIGTILGTPILIKKISCRV